MIATSVNYTAQSVALHQFVIKATKLDPPEYVPSIMLSTAFLEPVAGFLYVLSSIPAIRKEGFWFMKMEKNGLIRPNIRTLIPLFVLVYVGFSMATIHCLREDLKKSILSTVTITLSLTTYPFMLCMGWTKIWNVLTLIPRHKTGLGTTLTYFKPRTLNILSAFFYACPFAFSGPIIYLITLDLLELDRRLQSYEHAFSTIMTGKLQPQAVLKLNVEALTQLAFMAQRADKVLFFCRLIGFGYFLYSLVLLCLMLFGYHRILQAVRYPMRVFRQAVESQVPLTLSVVSLGGTSGPKTTVDSTSLDTSRGDTSMLKRRRKVFETGLQLPSWLPAFRQGPDFLQKPCASLTSDNPHLNNSQPWARNETAISHSQWNALRKYQVNLVWQVSCITLVLVVLMGMDVVIYSNYLEIPTRRSLSDLNWLTVCGTNTTWVWTMGIPFGLTAAIVAFSSPITASRE